LNRDEWDQLHMPADYARRGRPRGSGLDDRVSLRAIADLLEADPALKPTTAIKRIGVTDPSTIRRLRDKLRVEAEATPSRAELSERGNADSTRSSPPQMSAAGSVPAVARSEGSRRHGGYGPVHMMVWQETNTAVSWFTVWCALGLRAFSATVEAQLAAVEGILLVPEGASDLMRHETFCESRLAFSTAVPVLRTTVH
jgi:hypothetical protein